MNTTSDYAPDESPVALSARSPRDYLRVFGWNFFAPHRIDTLWNPPSGLPQTETRRAFVTIERWLVALLMWLPYLIAVLAFGLLISRPTESLWILAPMVPIWVLSVTWTALVHLPDRSEPFACLLSLVSWLVDGLGKFGWFVFSIVACVAAVAVRHPLSAVVTIGAAMISSSIGYGMYRAMLYPLLPHATSRTRPRFPGEYVKTFVLEWWTHIGMLTAAMFLLLVFIDDIRPSPAQVPLFLAALIGPPVLSYLVAAGTGRALSEGGAGALAALARAGLFVLLIACYAALIWLLVLGGWRTL